MSTITLRNVQYRSRTATAIYDLLNPIPFGMFVATLIFDIIFAKTGNVFWGKGAAWLVSVGLIVAIIPRLINLGHVWFGGRNAVTRIERMDFWVNLLGIVAAIVNVFVHSRDAYAMVPLNVIFSVVTVALLSIGYVALAFEKFGHAEVRHD
ncbi:putative Membrane protein [Candidatus Burkholderia humilis]|nr:putative Membrane protein [Candidatus Burkholderia humilis]